MANFGFTGPRQIANQHASALRAASVTALVVHAVDAEGNSAAPGGGSTQVSVREILTSSGASVIDSTVNAIGVSIRSGALAGTEYTDGDIDATVSGGAVLFANGSNTLRAVSSTLGLPVNIVAGAAGGSSQVSIKDILTSSGGSILDGTNVAMRVNIVAGAAGGSTEVTVRQSSAADFQATITPAAGSTFRTQPGSTAWASSAGFHFDSSGAMTVREQAPSTGPFIISSIVGVSIVRPEAGSTFNTRATQSSAADLQVTATPAAGSTWAVRPLQSSAADLQVTATPAAGSTFNVRPLQSSQADLRATVYQSSATEFKTTSFTADNLGNLIESSTKAAGTNSTMRGLAVRHIGPDSTFASGQAAGAGDNTIISSAATGIYVYAYAISALSTAAQLIRFLNGSTVECWRVRVLGGSTVGWSGTYSQMAVTPPGYLFRTAAGNPLVLNITSSGVNYSVSAWRE